MADGKLGSERQSKRETTDVWLGTGYVIKANTRVVSDAPVSVPKPGGRTLRLCGRIMGEVR